MQRIKWLGRFVIVAAAISLAAVGAIAVPARSAVRPVPAVVTSFTVPGTLWGVAATSAANAWAVGCTDAGDTLLLHWNGAKWSQVTSPAPVPGVLYAVTAVTADNVWVVGEITTPKGTDEALVEHWNGAKWSVPANVPVIPGELYGVTVSGNSIWAVGTTDEEPSLILHGVGDNWYVVPTEGPTGSSLYGIVVTGAKTGWAAGESYLKGNAHRPLLLRWNGTVWQSVSSPLQGADSALYSIVAGPKGAIWTGGTLWNSAGYTAVSMLWNGKTWRKVPAGSIADSVLDDFTFVPGGSGIAWGVGYSSSVLILQWSGHAWTQVANPEHGTDGSLIGVAATSVSNAWAVGYLSPSSQSETLILHWNGKTWS